MKMRQLTLTLDTRADELLSGYDNFYRRMHLRSLDGTTRGNVLFDKELTRVRFDTYEPEGTTVIEVSVDGKVEYHFETYAKKKGDDNKETEKPLEVVDGSGTAQLSDVFKTTRQVTKRLEAGTQWKYRLPEEAYQTLIGLINNPSTRTS